MGPTKIYWKRKPAYLSRYLKNVIGPYDLYMILKYTKNTILYLL